MAAYCACAKPHVEHAQRDAAPRAWYTGTEVSEHDESDAFGLRARRKPQQCRVALRGFATPPSGRKRAFVFGNLCGGVPDWAVGKAGSVGKVLAVRLHAAGTASAAVTVAFENLPTNPSGQVSHHGVGGPVLADDFATANSGSVRRIEWRGTRAASSAWEPVFNTDSAGHPATDDPFGGGLFKYEGITATGLANTSDPALFLPTPCGRGSVRSTRRRCRADLPARERCTVPGAAFLHG